MRGSCSTQFRHNVNVLPQDPLRTSNYQIQETVLQEPGQFVDHFILKGFLLLDSNFLTFLYPTMIKIRSNFVPRQNFAS
jgi:hypothetical protein